MIINISQPSQLLHDYTHPGVQTYASINDAMKDLIDNVILGSIENTQKKSTLSIAQLHPKYMHIASITVLVICQISQGKYTLF